MKTIILLSGGIDSTACIKFYLDLNYEVECVFCNYGQPALISEERAAKEVSKFYNVPLHCLDINSIRIPATGEICGRNALLVVQALCLFGFGTYKIVLGIHSGTNYSDCSERFINEMNRVLDCYTNGTVCLEAPFVKWFKNEIAAYCIEKKIPHDVTYSCEKGNNPCGKCFSCLDREELFNE